MVTTGEACENLVRTFALQAFWPLSSEQSIHLTIQRMMNDIASRCGKKIDDVSIEDVQRAQRKLLRLLEQVRLDKIRLSTSKTVINQYSQYSFCVSMVSDAYLIGNLFYGNFGPLLRRLGVQFSGAPLMRAAGIWLAGQVIIELYCDPITTGKLCGDVKTDEFHPLFDHFNLEQLRELSIFMGMDAKVSWSAEKLRTEIISITNRYYNNKVVALWTKRPQYKNILLTLCEELAVPSFTVNDSDEELEERLAYRIFCQSLEKMSAEEIANYESAIRQNTSDRYWPKALKSTLMLGGLTLGNLSGFGLYIASSSALAALGNGLGITFAWGTFTSLSSALSVAFGPVSLAVAAGAAAFHWTDARPRKLLPLVLFLTIARGRLQAEAEQQRTAIQKLILAIKKALRIITPMSSRYLQKIENFKPRD